MMYALVRYRRGSSLRDLPSHPQKNKTTSEHLATFTEQQQSDIREAVFRYQFRHNSSIQGSKAAVYCLSVENNRTTS